MEYGHVSSGGRIWSPLGEWAALQGLSTTEKGAAVHSYPTPSDYQTFETKTVRLQGNKAQACVLKVLMDDVVLMESLFLEWSLRRSFIFQRLAESGLLAGELSKLTQYFLVSYRLETLA